MLPSFSLEDSRKLTMALALERGSDLLRLCITGCACVRVEWGCHGTCVAVRGQLVESVLSFHYYWVLRIVIKTPGSRLVAQAALLLSVWSLWLYYFDFLFLFLFLEKTG